MTENAKTGIFAGTAAALGLLAWLSMPQQITSVKEATEERIGKLVFEKFVDPQEASSLEISKYNEETGTYEQFQLRRDPASGAWVIPSHDSYPADAASQVSKVANSFIGLRILTVESAESEAQKLYGVVEPDAAKLDVGDTGVGTLVKLQNDKGEVLVDLIIGKTVKDDDKKRFVRRAGSDPIYTVELDTSPITTDFSKWIEGDLLKLSSNDIAALTIRDYNVLPGNLGSPSVLSKNFDAELEYSIKDAKWNAKSIKVFQKGGAVDRTVGDDEELNTTKLNEIKNTLDNLKIVNVVRKPKGLAADLKAEKELIDDNTKMLSLLKQGFLPYERPDGTQELYASSGELSVKLNDGVEYLLRFGNATAGKSSDEEAEPAAEGKSTPDADAVGLNRSLFVTARLDESHYPMPTLTPVPETIEDLKALEAKEKELREQEAAASGAAVPPTTADPVNETPAKPEPPAADAAKPEETKKEEGNKEEVKDEGSKKDEASKQEESKVEASKEATKEATEETSKAGDAKAEAKEAAPSEPEAKEATEAKDSPAKSDQSRVDARPATRLVRLVAEEGKEGASGDDAPAAKEDKSPASEPAKATDDGKAADAPATADAAKPVEPAKPAEESKANETAKAADDKRPAVETEQELKERLEAARERITKDNTRLLDDRKDRMEAARKKAAELNARFAEWYYKVSDAEYKRLRVSLDDLVKKKGAASSAPPATPGLPPGGGLPFGFPGTN